MIRIKKKIFTDICFFEDLELVDKWLFEEAINVREKAQAPYSHYKVGASVLVHNEGSEKIFSGCNVERCTWTQTTHAEQNAIDKMISLLGSKKILKLCVVGATESKEIKFLSKADYDLSPTCLLPKIEHTSVPCGHCLQIIWENCFGDPNIKLFSTTKQGFVSITTIDDAFPMRFGPEDLGIKYK